MKKDVEEFMMNNGLEGVGVYCGTYAKYNGGSLYGAWLDMEKFSDAEEFFEVCRLLHNDEEDPELMFQDFTGFPESLYGESMNEEEVQAIIDWANLEDNDREMLEDFMDVYCVDVFRQYGDIDDMLTSARERCEGKWDSLDDFADHMADEAMCEFEAAADGGGYMSSEARYAFKATVKFLRENFSYESYRENMRHYYSEGNHGWIFCD